MVKRSLVVVGVLVAAFALKNVSAQTKPSQYVVSVDAVKYTPLDPKAPDGANVSVVSGDLKGKGPITLFLKLPKGAAPMHTHTASYHAVLVSGQAKHWPAGAEAKAQTLNPGSHWYQPGKALHGDECLAAHCVIYLEFDGPYDFLPVTK